MLCHPVKGRYQLTPPPSRFYLVHLPGEFLLDAFAQTDMVRTVNHITQKVDTLLHREHALVRFYLKPDPFHLGVDSITNLPQFRFRFTKRKAVIAITVEMTDTALIFQ